MKKITLIPLILFLPLLFASSINTIRTNYIESCEIYGISKVVSLNTDISFTAKIPRKYKSKKCIVDYSRVEFGMVYDSSDCKLRNYDGSFLVTLSTENEKYEFIFNPGINALYLDRDDYQVFNFPDTLFDKDVNVSVKILNPDFPEYINNVFFYISRPRK